MSAQAPVFFPLFCVFRDSKARRATPYRSVKRRKSMKSAAMGLSPSRTINIISLAASLELQRAPGSPLGMFWSLSCSRGRDGSFYSSDLPRREHVTSVLRHRFQRASEGFCLVLPDLSGKKKRSGRRKKKSLPPGFDVHLAPADVTAAGVQGDSGVCPGASLDGSRQVAIPPPICQLVRRRHVGSRHRPYAQIATASKCHLFSGGCTAGGVG